MSRLLFISAVRSDLTVAHEPQAGPVTELSFSPHSPRVVSAGRPGNRRWQRVACVIAPLVVVAACGTADSEDQAAQLADTVTATTTATTTVVEVAAPAPSSSRPSGSAIAGRQNASAGNQNAVRSAQQYLAISGFSRSGLIEQLQYEGYSESDASGAVDSLPVD